MIILALTGFARSGKDTVADHLVENHGFTRKSFAAPLKEMARKLNPILGRHPYHPYTEIRYNEALETFGEDAVKSTMPEYRRLLQTLGTDCVRSLDEGFWVNAAMQDLAASDPAGRFVFTDCRFPNEADAIRKQLLTRDPEDIAGRRGPGSLRVLTDVWQISRPGFEAVNGHVSEQHVGRMGESKVLLNKGTIVQFRSLIDFHVEDLLALGAAA